MGQALIEEDRAGGKTTIGFTKPNGLVGSKFEIYKSIEAIKQEQEGKTNYASKQFKELQKSLTTSNSKKQLKPAFSPEQLSDKKRPGGKVFIERPQEAREQLKSLAEESQAVLMKAGTEVDMRLHQLVGQALQQKEAMVKLLEQQLSQERAQREAMAQRFRD